MGNSARNFFTEEEGERILDAIRKAEDCTSGEIRVHLENYCAIDPVYRAVKVFEQLGMTATAERNGVLIYLAVKDHKFAIVGDKGIDEQVPDNFWDEVKEAMQKHFRNKDFLNGLTTGIASAGEKLAEFFPPNQDDENELPDDISFGGEQQ